MKACVAQLLSAESRDLQSGERNQLETTMLFIGNRGQEIGGTNYWDSENARNGLFYLSWNAGAARLLVPDRMLPAIDEMRTASHAVISRGPRARPKVKSKRDALEILFEDGSDAPYLLQLGPEQTDALPPKSDAGRESPLIIWARLGEQLRMSAKFQVVSRLPTLE